MMYIKYVLLGLVVFLFLDCTNNKELEEDVELTQKETRYYERKLAEHVEFIFADNQFDFSSSDLQKKINIEEYDSTVLRRRFADSLLKDEVTFFETRFIYTFRDTMYSSYNYKIIVEDKKGKKKQWFISKIKFGNVSYYDGLLPRLISCDINGKETKEYIFR